MVLFPTIVFFSELHAAFYTSFVRAVKISALP